MVTSLFSAQGQPTTTIEGTGGVHLLGLPGALPSSIDRQLLRTFELHQRNDPLGILEFRAILRSLRGSTRARGQAACLDPLTVPSP